MWVGAQYTPIYANDPKAGKIYCIKAGGIMTMSVATCTFVITPRYGTGGTSMGASPAQLLPAMTGVPWILDAELIWCKIGVSTGSWAICIGKFCCQGTIATAGAGTVIPFGGLTNVTSLDATINSCLEICVTAGGTVGSPTLITHYAYIFSRN
jgi:hypothetical protein